MEEERLLSEHKLRLAQRKANKEALQRRLLDEFLSDVDSTQRNLFLRQFYSVLQKLKQKKELIMVWEQKWMAYQKAWLDLGVETENLGLWFDLGIDDPKNASRFIEIFSKLGTRINPNRPFDRLTLRAKLEAFINYLSTQETVALLVELENLQLLHFDDFTSDAIFSLHLAYETGSVQPLPEFEVNHETWFFAENVINGEKLPERLSQKKINNLKLEIIDYAIENGSLTRNFVDQITSRVKRDYLLARLEPDSKYLTNAVVSELNWTDEEMRRRFLLNDYLPDMENVPQLRNLQKLKIGIDFDLSTVIEISENPELHIQDRITALDIVQFVEFGELSESLEKDTDTWKIIFKLSPEHCFSKADALSRTRFRRWCFVRMLQYFVLTDNFDDYVKYANEELIRALYDNKPLKTEIFTGFAFLHLRQGQKNESKKRFQDAFNLIENDVTRHNLNLMKIGGFNVDRLNPHLVAQLPHDVSPEQWRRQLNQLRADAARLGSEKEIHLNWAKGIKDPQVKVSAAELEKVFKYPAIPQLYSTEPHGTFLHPPARPLPRRYFLEETIGSIREDMFATILPKIRQVLTTTP